MKKVVLGLMLSVVVIAPAFAETSEAVLLDFYADWCGPCHEMRPTVDAIRAAGYCVKPINIDTHRSLATAYRIECVPCFVMTSNGQETDRLVGPASYEQLETLFCKTARREIKEKNAADSPPKPAWRYEFPTGYHRAIVRVFCEENQGKSIGTGTLIRWNGRIAVLTARHVVKGAKKITVWFCTGETQSARLLSDDATWDVAVLELDGLPENIAPVALEQGSDAMQREGNRLESCGYGSDARLACNTGVFIGYRRSTAAPQGPDDWMVLSGRARSGDSGGPVFNERGRLVGVLWGTDGKEVVCVQAGRIHVVLNSALPPQRFEPKASTITRIPTQPAESVAIESLPIAPVKEAKPFDNVGKNIETRCAPRPRDRMPSLPTVTVQSDPEVRHTLGNIDAKVGVLVEQRQAEQAAERAAQTESSPLIAGLCILGAIVAGAVVYFATQAKS